MKSEVYSFFLKIFCPIFLLSHMKLFEFSHLIFQQISLWYKNIKRFPQIFARHLDQKAAFTELRIKPCRPGFPATSFGPAPAPFFQAGAAWHHFNPFPHDPQARALRRPSTWPSASSRSASTVPRTPRLRPLTPPNETQTLNLISRLCGPEQARSAAAFFSQIQFF